jgi:hypothetical protein
MTTALFGLLGVVVGGVLTGMVTYALERVRTKRAARAASRLLVEDLHSALMFANTVKGKGTWQVLSPDAVERTFVEPAAVWLKHRELLASTLSGKEWVALSLAYGEGLGLLYSLYLDGTHNGSERDSPIPPWMDFLLLAAISRISPGVRVLQAYGDVNYERDDALAGLSKTGDSATPAGVTGHVEAPARDPNDPTGTERSQ